MEVEKYVEQFSKIFQLVKEKSWSDEVDKTEVSLAILQEFGKDRRMESMRSEREKGKEPATEKQKQYMEDLGIVYDEDITKEKASREIERALGESSK